MKKPRVQHLNFLFFSSCLMMLENNFWLKRQSPDVNPSWAILLQCCQLPAESKHENRHARFSEWQPFPHALRAHTFPEVRRFDLGFIFVGQSLKRVWELAVTMRDEAKQDRMQEQCNVDTVGCFSIQPKLSQFGKQQGAELMVSIPAWLHIVCSQHIQRHHAGRQICQIAFYTEKKKYFFTWEGKF